tara:strand:- start:3952 stop:4158 length:207 start_codon:yes stop_codon:yes gene_type:complete
MNLILCDGNWTVGAGGTVACSGVVSVVSQDQLGHSAMTLEDAKELTGQTMFLFAVVFGVLAVKKALQL